MSKYFSTIFIRLLPRIYIDILYTYIRISVQLSRYQHNRARARGTTARSIRISEYKVVDTALLAKPNFSASLGIKIKFPSHSLSLSRKETKSSSFCSIFFCVWKFRFFSRRVAGRVADATEGERERVSEKEECTSAVKKKKSLSLSLLAIKR